MFWFLRREWPSISVEEIRKRSRLLVIEDQEFPYESLFVRDGYNLEKWHDVERLSDVEGGKYDLLLLDPQGVGRQESAEQGFGVLKYLRANCPTLVIVAYSNAEWGLKYQDFFKLADAVLPKSADYVEFKARVDELLTRRFSLGFYITRVLREATPYDVDPNRLEGLTRRAILGRNPKKLRKYLEATIANAATVEHILSIVKMAIGILEAWRTH
jgi:DNA-binding response OmpR family regulator